jgi:hypothetical protein
MTFDRAGGAMTYDGAGNHLGRRLPGAFQTHDGRTVDSTGAFLIGELERLDPTMHAPLVQVSWQRDIDLRTDVTLADEVSSFTLSTFASQGGLGAGNGIGNGKSWAGKKTDQVATVGIDIAKLTNPLTIWMNEIAFTLLELESAAKTGRPIDQQKFDALKLKNQMDIDEQVYIGDTSLNVTGLVNNAGVSVTNLPAGAVGSPLWANKTPDEILADVNAALTTVWQNSAWAVLPTRILIPPTQFGQISTQKVSLAGNVSVLKYILDNNVTTTKGGGQLEIEPLKWCIGAGAGGTVGTVNGHDRMVVYTRDKDRVRFPMTEMGRTPLQYDSIWQKTTYYQKLGVVEVVYPDTLGYFDGL